MTIDELIERLDIETDGLGSELRRLMKDDTSSVEHIDADYELLEGGDCESQREYIESVGGVFTESTWNIKSFIVWTCDFIYHFESDDHAYLYEDGRIYSVARHPSVSEGVTTGERE